MWFLILLNSPFLVVFGDDRVTRYTGADHADGARTAEWGLAGLELGIFTIDFMVLWKLVITFDLISFEYCLIDYWILFSRVWDNKCCDV